MMIRVRRVLLVGCLAATVISAAQRLPVRFYTTEDGLWSGFINSMIRDSHGFLWFATRDGLSRFDGYGFTNYTIASGPPSQNFTFIFESREGVFWIVLGDDKLYRYDPRAIKESPAQVREPNDNTRIPLPAELVASRLVNGMLEDRSGNLWAASGAGLFRIEQNAGQVFFHEVDLHLPQSWKPSFQVRTLAEGDDGSLWLGTSHGLLRRLPDGRVVQHTVNPRLGQNNDVRLVLVDKAGYLWAIFARVLYIVKPEPLATLSGAGPFTLRPLRARAGEREIVMPAKSGEAINLAMVQAFGAQETLAIYQLSNGRIWFVMRDRLVFFDGRQCHAFVDARNMFAGLMEDLDGDLWMSNRSGGVAKLSVRGFMSYDHGDGLADGDVASIQEDREGRITVVGPRWVISQLGEKKVRSVRPNIPDMGWRWTSNLALLDHTGQWWLLTSRGLYRFAPVQRLEDLERRKPSLYRNLDGLPGQSVYCMFEDSRGDLWISIRNPDHETSGLVRWQRSDETFHSFKDSEGMPPASSAGSFAEDRTGNLWFGFYQGGLARYSAGRFQSFSAAEGLPKGFITTLYIDHMGRLWLASNTDGVARLDDPEAEHPRFVRYTTRQGLASDNVRALTEDLGGDIYIGTVRGIDRLNTETGKIRHYGLADGLAGDFVTRAFRDHNGTLWFGSFGGVSRFEPRQEPPPTAPAIRIESLRIAGVKQPLGEFGAPAIAGLELTSAQNNLQIDFSSLSMARAALLRYQYKLEGVDSGWSVPSEQRAVHYANLAPGAYRFLVRAVDPAGVNSAQPASVDFRILPPVWQRWWFLILAAALLGCAATFLYRYRVAHLLELERIRIRIATDLHDDIGSSLSQIAVLSEVVRRQVEGHTAVSQPLSTIASTSRELVDSMSDIVWAINPDRDNLGDLSQRMRRFASDLLTMNDIELQFVAREIETTVKLDAETRRQIFLIFKECVNNIVRHSGCTRVEINLGAENRLISLTIKDDGIGFDKAQPGHGHGLSSMQQRAESLGASLHISSPAGGGTTVLLQVPLARHVALL